MQRPYHHEAHEGHEEIENSYISISYFVPFATFVVKFCSDFWLRLCYARSFVRSVVNRETSTDKCLNLRGTTLECACVQPPMLIRAFVIESK